MKNKKVSVIIPTRNSSRTLGQCLQSIKKQSSCEVEIIVVDNNSIDNTRNIALKYTDLVFNCGPERSAQRNFGVKKASGEFVLFIDSDMVLSKTVVSECIESFVKNSSLMVIIPEISFGDGFWSKCKVMERSFYLGLDWMEGARFFSKKIFVESGGYDINNTGTEDFDLPQRIEAKFGIKSKSRISSFIYHDEGKVNLLRLLKKKYYYTSKLREYQKKEYNNRNYKKQTSIFERYALFFSKPNLILNQPIVFSGMLVMKTLEFIFGGLGLIRSQIVEIANIKRT